MEATYDATIPAPANRVDLVEWVFQMTDAEYRACSRNHYAMGIVGGAKRLGIINVEQVAGALIVQRYAPQLLEKNRVTLFSQESQAFLARVIPFKMEVTWDMQVLAESAGSSRLRCSLTVKMPLWVKVAGWFIASHYLLKRHLIGETKGFARDIASKLFQAPPDVFPAATLSS